VKEKLVKLLLLGLLLLSQVAQAQTKWDEQDFSSVINVGSHAVESSNTEDLVHNLTLNTSFVYLFDGFSTKGSLGLSKQLFEIENRNESEKESYDLALGIRYYVNEFSNLDVILSHNDSHSLANPINYRFFATRPRITNDDFNSLVLSFSLGNDQTLRMLSFNAKVIDSESADVFTATRLRKQKTLQAQVSFDHRFTEDSFWSADTEIRTGDYGNLDSISERTYSDVRAGFRTRYLGNSTISLLAGISNQDQSDLLDSNTVSWKIRNTLNLTENLSLNLESVRQFNYSDNPNFSTVDQIASGLDIKYSYTEQLTMDIAVKTLRKEYSEQDWSEDNSVSIRANYLYNDHLLIFFESELAELKGNQTELNFDNKSASLGIKFELL